MPSTKKYFPSAEEFPREAPEDGGWNCLMFALGITPPAPKYDSKFELNHDCELGEAFLRKVDELYSKFHLEFDSKSFKRIETPPEEESDAKIFFKVFGFKEVITAYLFGFPVYKHNFHVMRGMRSNSGRITWEEIPGWEENEVPREVTSEDLNNWDEEFGNNYVVFAFIPPKR